MKPAPQLDLQPLNANASIVDQAYMALTGAIMDADITTKNPVLVAAVDDHV